MSKQRWPVRGLVTALASGLCVLAVCPAHAITVRVGTNDPYCDYSDLAAALSAVAASGTDPDTVYLTSNYAGAVAGPLTIDLEISGNLTIKGGVDDCFYTSQHGYSTLDVASGAGFVVHGGVSTARTFLLDGVILRPAAGSSGVGRMLDISGFIQATVGNSMIEGGSADEGGLARVSGAGAFLTTDYPRSNFGLVGGTVTGDGGGFLVDGGGLNLVDAVSGGQAGGHGGGVACRNGGHVTLRGALHDNVAGLGGGALSASGCSADVMAELYANTVSLPGGEGGAIWADNDAQVDVTGWLGQAGSAGPMIHDNSAELGGAVFAGGGSVVTMTDAELSSNAAVSGGGVMVTGAGTQLTLSRSRLAAGTATTAGGGLAVEEGAGASIDRTVLSNNSAPSGSALSVVGLGSSVVLESDLLGGNTGGALVEARDGGALTFALSTAVANDLAGGVAIAETGSGTDVALATSVLLDGRIFAPPTGAETRSADCIIALDLTDLPTEPRAGSYLQVGTPGEVLAHTDGTSASLRYDSPAIDYCDGAPYLPQFPDIDDETRVYDHPPAGSSRFGILDLGADESRALFDSNFESGDCSEWSSALGCG